MGRHKLLPKNGPQSNFLTQNFFKSLQVCFCGIDLFIQDPSLAYIFFMIMVASTTECSFSFNDMILGFGFWFLFLNLNEESLISMLSIYD